MVWIKWGVMHLCHLQNSKLIKVPILFVSEVLIFVLNVDLMSWKEYAFHINCQRNDSQGREVLSVCPQLLDFIADPFNPIKREVLIDMSDLPGTTGVAITTAILNSVQKHAIDITNCRGETYYANASMSSDKKGVQAEIARCVPDAEYQGCCLLSINLVICLLSVICYRM